MKFLKVGRVAIITRGRYAGKKVRISSPRANWFGANKTMRSDGAWKIWWR
jgi:hypothetical protein